MVRRPRRGEAARHPHQRHPLRGRPSSVAADRVCDQRDVATIEQQGGVVAVATPYDGELARRAGADRGHPRTDERRRARRDTARSLGAAGDRAGRPSGVHGRGGGAKPMGRHRRQQARWLTSPSPSSRPIFGRSGARGKLRRGEKKERGEILVQIGTRTRGGDAGVKHAAPKPAATALDTKVMDSLRKGRARRDCVLGR